MATSKVLACLSPAAQWRLSLHLPFSAFSSVFPTPQSFALSTSQESFFYTLTNKSKATYRQKDPHTSTVPSNAAFSTYNNFILFMPPCEY